jgi:hypothetical protein
LRAGVVRKTIEAGGLVEDADPSLDGSLTLVAKIVSHTLVRIQRSADQFGELDRDNLEALETCGRLAMSMKKAKPDGVPMPILRRVGVTAAQFEQIAVLMEEEERKKA